MPKIINLFILFLISTSLSIASPQVDLEQVSKQSYIYAYPLVISGLTKDSMTNVSKPETNGHPRAPINQFIHLKTFPDANTAKDVVRPNVDTLYSIAWLDLSKQPMVLTLPDAQDRYYIIQLLDAWTNVFSSIGKRNTGSKAQQYAIVSPDWKGNLPNNIKKIQAPTNLVWLIGRTQTNGKTDYENVNQFQANMRLLPLSELYNNTYQAPLGEISPFVNDRVPPPKQIQNMDNLRFFKLFAELLKNNPPHKSDSKILATLKQMGIIPGNSFDTSKFSAQDLAAIQAGAKEGFAAIEQATSKGQMVNGWLIRKDDIGSYGNNYLTHAAVAMWALGANLPQDAIYPSTAIDGQGNTLNGVNNYLLHFNKDQLPPVNGFWSITLYDSQGYFVKNNINRYALGDRDKLNYNTDGSLDIYIQQRSPGINKETNWLPAPPHEFNLLMRLYWPKTAVISGKWAAPAVEKIS